MTTVRDVMTTPVVTAQPDTTFGELVELLLGHDVSGLPVVDADGRVIGIVTEADLVDRDPYGQRRRPGLGLLAESLRGRDLQWVQERRSRTASDLMTPDPSIIGPDEDLVVATRRMLQRGHKRLPVVEDGSLVGIVSRADLLRALVRTDAAV
jgi:CBS domain-containing protein